MLLLEQYHKLEVLIFVRKKLAVFPKYLKKYFQSVFPVHSINHLIIPKNIFVHICWRLYPLSKTLMKRFLGQRAHAFKIYCYGHTAL